jgi:hypothetical protein
MNDLERAVIEAARAYMKSDPFGMIAAGERAPRDLADAVNALDSNRPSMEDLETELVRFSANGIRARNILRVWFRGGPITPDEFAALPWEDVMDIRGAGATTWRTWAKALRALGIEPAWAKQLAGGPNE